MNRYLPFKLKRQHRITKRTAEIFLRLKQDKQLPTAFVAMAVELTEEMRELTTEE